MVHLTVRVFQEQDVSLGNWTMSVAAFVIAARKGEIVWLYFTVRCFSSAA